MVIYKNVNGVKIPMTEEEELTFNSFIEGQKAKEEMRVIELKTKEEIDMKEFNEFQKFKKMKEKSK
jgi:hypothetical protein